MGMKRNLRKLPTTFTSKQLMRYEMMFLLSWLRETLPIKEFPMKGWSRWVGVAHLQTLHLNVLWAQCLSCISSLSCGMMLPQYEHCSWPGGMGGACSSPTLVWLSSIIPSTVPPLLLPVAERRTWPCVSKEVWNVTEWLLLEADSDPCWFWEWKQIVNTVSSHRLTTPANSDWDKITLVVLYLFQSTHSFCVVVSVSGSI